VAGGITTAVGILNFKLRRVEKGTATGRSERLRVLEEKLRDAEIEIEALKRRNKALEEQILLTENGKDVGKGVTATVKPVVEKCLVQGDSIIRNFGAEKPNMRVECFPGIIPDELRRVWENRNIGYSDTVVIHVGTNVRRSRNLDYVTGEVYDLVNTAKAKFTGSRLVLSGVLRNRSVNWRRVGAANGRLEWVARNLGVTFVDPKSWIQDVDFGRKGLHLKRNGVKLGDLYSRVYGRDSESQVMSNWLHKEGSEFIEVTSEGSRKRANQNNSTLGLEAVEAEMQKKRLWIMQTRKKAGHRTKSKPRYRRTKMKANHWFCYR